MKRFDTAGAIGCGPMMQEVNRHLNPVGGMVGYDINPDAFNGSSIEGVDIEEAASRKLVIMGVAVGYLADVFEDKGVDIPRTSTIQTLDSTSTHAGRVCQKYVPEDEYPHLVRGHFWFGPQSIIDSVERGEDPVRGKIVYLTEVRGNGNDVVDYWANVKGLDVQEITDEEHDALMLANHVPKVLAGALANQCKPIDGLTVDGQLISGEALVGMQHLDRIHSAALKIAILGYNEQADELVDRHINDLDQVVRVGILKAREEVQQLKQELIVV